MTSDRPVYVARCHECQRIVCRDQSIRVVLDESTAHSNLFGAMHDCYITNYEGLNEHR